MSVSTISKSRADDTYEGLAYGRTELAEAMRQTYAELIAFVTQPAFAAVYNELWSLPWQERPGFVRRVVLQPAELKRRGVEIPKGILIQASAFGDRRPTLFAVKKFLPKKFHNAWENVNLTFDNEYDDADISREPLVAWRKPLPVSLQDALISAGADLETVPDIGTDDAMWSHQLGKTAAPD